jgi:hypothetical protein
MEDLLRATLDLPTAAHLRLSGHCAKRSLASPELAEHRNNDLVRAGLVLPGRESQDSWIPAGCCAVEICFRQIRGHKLALSVARRSLRVQGCVSVVNAAEFADRVDIAIGR